MCFCRRKAFSYVNGLKDKNYRHYIRCVKCQSRESAALNRIKNDISNGSQRQRHVIIITYLRITELHEVIPDLFEEHDDSHLQAQINQTTARVTLRK